MAHPSPHPISSRLSGDGVGVGVGGWVGVAQATSAPSSPRIRTKRFSLCAVSQIWVVCYLANDTEPRRGLGAWGCVVGDDFPAVGVAGEDVGGAGGEVGGAALDYAGDVFDAG